MRTRISNTALRWLAIIGLVILFAMIISDNRRLASRLRQIEDNQEFFFSEITELKLR